MHLFSKTSTIKRLLYAGWRSCCKAFVARKVCTIAWAKREQESCHLTSNNQPLFISWKFLGGSILGLYCIAQRAYVTQESVGPRIFVRKKGMNRVQFNGRSQQTPSAKFGQEKLACSDATTRFPQASYLKKPTRSDPETWGRMYDVLALRN
jgi:hypothetical protein